ncbi:hypothetical protein Ddye_019979 [Dipteronia dyeriana]|uniref:Uncharacterized protein n=1 Tax=Dipteronia dyeriana TaxID=168575 RepID=A0AAD9TYT4_9ROSI|nr:hypothetical protein Ddye_019979 [Dipteronia dyeriana]
MRSIHELRSIGDFVVQMTKSSARLLNEWRPTTFEDENRGGHNLVKPGVKNRNRKSKSETETETKTETDGLKTDLSRFGYGLDDFNYGYFPQPNRNRQFLTETETEPNSESPHTVPLSLPQIHQPVSPPEISLPRFRLRSSSFINRSATQPTRNLSSVVPPALVKNQIKAQG